MLTSKPCTADSLAKREAIDSITNGDDITNNLVTGDPGEDVAHITLLDSHVGEAHTTGADLDKDFSGAGLL